MVVMTRSLEMEVSATNVDGADLSPNKQGFAMADRPARLNVRVSA